MKFEENTLLLVFTYFNFIADSRIFGIELFSLKFICICQVVDQTSSVPLEFNQYVNDFCNGWVCPRISNELFSVKIFFTFFNYKFLLLIKISSFFPPRFIIRNIWSDEDLFPVRKNQKRIWTMIRRTTKSKYASTSAKVIIVFSEKTNQLKLTERRSTIYQILFNGS